MFASFSYLLMFVHEDGLLQVAHYYNWFSENMRIADRSDKSRFVVGEKQTGNFCLVSTLFADAVCYFGKLVLRWPRYILMLGESVTPLVSIY